MLSTFTVTKLGATGAGSLRQAIIQSNQNPGADTIDFAVQGTIHLGGASLPAISGPVNINGASAPTFAGAPLVTVDFQGAKGLTFNRGSDGSTLQWLNIVGSRGPGVTLVASKISVLDNYIGPEGGKVRISPTSHHDVIRPVPQVTYYTSDSVGVQPISSWTGARESNTPGQYLLTGTSKSTGLLYVGPISGVGGTPYTVAYPGSTVSATSPYGPDVINSNTVRVVGTYTTTTNSVVNGFVMQGSYADLAHPTNYQTIDYPHDAYTYVHSTMGDLAVGNAGQGPAATDHAFIYGLSEHRFLANIVYPGVNATDTTAYGVWYNGGSSYTIAGGYNTLGKPGGGPVSRAYLVDYNAATGQFSNWALFSAPRGMSGSALATHFQGISSPAPGVYTMSAASTDAPAGMLFEAALVVVNRTHNGSFGPASWVNVSDPNAVGIESANSVSGNQIVGIATTSDGNVSFQATVNRVF